jgi:hypothetical protein
MCMIKVTVRQCVLRNANKEKKDDTVSHEHCNNCCVRLLPGTVMSPSLYGSASPYEENQYTTFQCTLPSAVYLTIVCTVVPVLKWLSITPWWHRGEWMYSSTILDLGTRWRWVASFTLLPLYPRYPLDRRLGRLQSRPGRCREKTLCPCWESNPARTACRPSLWQLNYPVQLPISDWICLGIQMSNLNRFPDRHWGPLRPYPIDTVGGGFFF